MERGVGGTIWLSLRDGRDLYPHTLLPQSMSLLQFSFLHVDEDPGRYGEGYCR